MDEPDIQEALSKKAFTQWINQHLKKHIPPYVVNDIYKDLRSGVLILALYEQLTGEHLKYATGNNLGILDYIQNIDLAIHTLEKDGLSLGRIHASDIFEGKKKTINALLWNIILYYEVQKQNPKLWETLLEERRKYSAKMEVTGESKEFATPQTTAFPLFPTEMFDFGAPRQFLQDWCNQNISSSFDVDSSNFSRSIKEDTILLNTLLKYLEQIFTKQTRTSHSHVHGPLVVHEGAQDNLDLKEAKCMYERVGEKLGLSTLNFDILLQKFDERSIVTYLIHYFQQYLNFIKQKMNEVATSSKTQHEGSAIGDNLDQLLESLKVGVYNLINQADPAISYIAQKEYLIWCKIMNRNSALYDNVRSLFVSPNGRDVTYLEIWNNLEASWIRLDQIKKAWSAELNDILFNQIYQIYFVGNEQMEDHDLSSRATLTGSRSYDVIPRSSSKDNIKAKNAKVDSLTSRASLESSQDRLGQDLSTNRGLAQPAPSLLNINEVGIDTNGANSASNPGIPDPGKAFKHDKSRHNNIKIDAYRLAAIYQFLMCHAKCKETFDLFNKTLQKYVQSNAEYSPSLLLSHHHTPPVEMSEDVIVCDPQLNENLKSLLTKLKNLVKSMDHSLLLESNKCLDAEWPAIINQLHTTVDDIEVVSNAWDVYKSAYNEGKIWLDNMESAQKITLDDIESHEHLFTEIDKYGSILAANCPQYTAPTFHSSFSQLIERWIVLKSQYERCKTLDQKSWFERTDSSKLVGLNRGENKHSFADTFEDSDSGESVIRSTSYTKKFQESVKDKEVVITKMNQRIFLQPVVVTSTPDSQEPLARNVLELTINQHVLTPIYQSFFDLESRVNPDASFDLYLERLKIYLRKCLEALQKIKEDSNTKANAVSQSLVNDKIENIHSMLEHLEPTETFELPHIEGKLEEWELFLTRNALSECKVVDVEGMWEKYKIIVDQVALPLGRMLNQLVQVYNKLITTFPYQNMDFTEFKTRMNAFIARYEENVKNSNRFDKSLKSLIAPSTKYTYLMDCVYKYIAKVKDVLQTNLKDSRDSSKKFAIKLDDDIYQKFLTQSERLSLVLSNSQRLDVAQKTSKVKQDWQACQAEINFATLLNNFKVHESRFNGYIDKALIELNYQTDTFKSGNYELNSILQRNTEYFASQKLLFPIKEDLDNMRDFVEEYQKNLDALKSKGENVYQLLNTDSSLMQLLSTVSGDSKSDLLSFHHQMQADLNADLLKWQNLQSKNTIYIKRLRSAISKRTQFTEKFDEIVGGANTIEADIENLLGYLKFQKDHHDIYNMIQDTRLRLENLLSLMASVEKMLTDQDYIQDVPESMQENDKANFETLRLNLKSLLSYLQGIVVTSDTGDQKSQSKERVRDALKDSQNTMIKTDSPVQNSVKINISAGSEDLNLHKKVKLGISSIDIGELEGYKNELKIKPFPDTFRGGDLGDKNDRYKTVSFTPLTKPVAEIGKLDQDQSSPHKSSIMMDIHLDEAQNPNSKTELFSHPTTSSSSQNLSNIKKQSNFTTLTKQIDPFNKFDDQYYTDSSHQPANETQDHQSQLSSEMNLTKEVDNGQINYRPNTKMQENSGQISSPDSVDSSPFFDPKIIPQGPKTADGVSEFLEKDDNKRLKLGKNADDEANDQASDFRVLASFKALKKGDLARMSFDDDGQIIQTRASFSKDVNSMEPKAMQKGVKGVPNKNTTTPLFDEISGSYENPDDKNKTKGMQKENKDLVVDKSVIEKKSGKTFFTSEPDDKEVVINVTDFMSLPSKINMNEPLDKVTPSTEKAAEDEQAYPKRYSMPEGSIVFSKFKEEGTKTDAGIVSCPTTLDAQKMEIDKSLSSKEYSLDIKKTPSLDKKETTSHDLNPLATIKLPTGGDNNKKNVKIRKDVGESQSDDFSTFSAPKVAFQGFKIEGANEILHKEDDRKLAKNVKGGTNDQANDKQILAFPEELEKGGLVRSTSGDAGKTLLTSTNFGKENKDDIMDKGTIESGKTHLPAQTVDDGVVINVTDFMTMPTSTNLDVPQEELSSSIEKFDEQSTDPKRDSLPEGAIVFPKFEEEGTKTDAGVVLSPITPEAQKEEKDKVLEVGAFPFNVQKEVTSNIKNNTLQDSMRQPLITTKLAQENLQMDNTIERDGTNIRDNNKTAGDEERRIEKTKSFLPDIRPWVGGVKIPNTYPEIPSSNNLTETSQLSTPSQPSTQAIMQSAHATSGQEYLEQIPKSPESPFVKFYHQYPHDTFGSKGHVSDKTRDKLITNDQHEPDERKEPVDDGKKDTITPPNSPEDQSLNNFDTNLNTEAPSNSKSVTKDKSTADMMGGKLLKEEEKKLMTFSDDLFKLEEQLESIDDPSRKDHHSSLLLYVSYLKDKCEQILPLITRDKKHLKELLPRVKDLELTLERGEALLSDRGLNDNAPKFDFSRLEKDFKNLSDTKGLSQLKHELSDYVTVLDPVSSTILNDASKKLQAIQTLEDIRNKGVTTLPSEYENKDKEGLNKSSWINDLANKFSNLNEKLKTKYAQLQALSSNLDTVIPFVKKCETQNEEIQRWVGVTTNALDDPSKPLNDLVKLMPKIMKEREHLTSLLNDSANACNSICDPSLAITQKLRANITTNQKSLKDIDKIISQIVKRQTTLASLENEMANESKSLQKKIDNYEKDQYKNKSEFDALFKKSTLNPSDINQMYKLLDAQKKLTEDLQPLDAIISRLDFKIHLAISENKCVDKDVEPLLNRLNLKRKAIVDISKKGWSNVDQLKSKLLLDFAERMKEMNPITETTKQQLSELENCPLGSINLEAHKEKFRQINDNLKRLNALISDASKMYLDTPLLTKVQNGLMGGEDINEEKVLEKEFSVSGMKHDLEQLRNKISKFHDRHKVLETKFNDEMKDRQQYLEQLEALETNIVQDTTRLHSIDLGEDYDTVLDKLNSGLKPALKSYVDTYGPKLNELEKWASSNPQNMASGAAGKKTPLERIRTILVSTYEPTLTWANDRIKDEEIIGKEGETLGLETNFLLDKNIEDLKLLTDFIDKLNICHKTPKKLSEAKISPAPKLKSSTKALKGATPKSINDKNIIHGGQMLFKVAPDDLTPFDDDTGFGKDDLYEFTKNFNPKEISNIPEIVKMSLAKLNNAFESGSNNDKPLRPSNEEIGFNDVFTYLAHLRHMYTLLCQPLVKEIQTFSDRLGPSKPDRTLKNLRAELDSYRTKLDAIPAKFDDIEKQLVETLKTYFDSKLGALTTFVMDEVEKTDKTEMPKNFTNMDDLMDLRKHLIGKLKKIATANKVLDVVEKQCDEPKISGHMKSKIEALRALLLRSKTKYEEKLGGTEISVSKYWEASKNLDNFQTRYADFERKYKGGNQKETTLKDLKSSLEIFIDDINAFIKAHHDSLDPNATFTFEQMDSLRQKLRDLKSLSDTLLLNILNKIKGNGQKVTPEQQRVPKEKNVFTEQSAESQKTCAPLSPTMIERLTSYLPQTIHSAPPVNDIDFKDILKDEKIRISSSSTPFGDNNLLNYDTDDTGFGGSPQPTKMVIFENLDVKRDLPSSPLASPKLPLHINPSKGVTQEKQSGILNLRKSQPHKEQVNYDRIETIQRLLSTPTSPLDLGYNSPPHQLNLEALIIKLLDDTDKIIYEAKLNASLKLRGKAGSPLNLDKNDDVFHFSPATPGDDAPSTSTFHEKYTTMERLTELLGQLKLAMRNIDTVEDILTYPRLYDATFTIVEPHNTPTLKNDLKNKYQELVKGEKNLLQKINSSDSLIDNPSIKEFEEDTSILRSPSSVTPPQKNGLFGRLLSLKDKLISPKTSKRNGFQSKDLDNSSDNAPDFLIKIKNVNFKDIESPIKEDLSLIENVLKNIEDQVSNSGPDSSDKDLNLIPDSKNSSNAFAEKQIKSAKLGRERKTSNAKARVHDKQDNVPFNQTYIYRVIRASLPLQALLLSLLGLACLLPLCNDDYSCALRNNLLKSMAPTLNYPDGPPPL